jgi:long-chain fatty acid transport protein
VMALPGFSAYVGMSAITPSAAYEPTRGERVETTTPTALAPNAYASYQLSELVTVGLGVNSPFGLAIEWPASSPGRGVVREQALRTFFISPAAGLNLDAYVPGLLVGAGVDVVPAQVYLTRDFVFGDEIGSVELGGSALGFGGRAGISYAPPALPALTLGVAYRSPVQLDFDGEADFTADPSFRNGLPSDGAVTTSITLPQSVLAGVSYAVATGLTIELDANWIDWSAYDELVVELPGGVREPSLKDWHDTLVLRAGAEYRLGELALRAGYARDPSPVPEETLDFTLPDIDRNVVTAGVGYDLPHGIHLDAAALYVLPGSRTTAAGDGPDFKGTYEVQALVIAMSVGVRL